MNHKKKQHTLFDARIIRRALIDSLIKLNPMNQVRNPVMFVVEVGSILTTLLFVQVSFRARHGVAMVYPPYFNLALGYRALCQFCGISGGRPGQGTG